MKRCGFTLIELLVVIVIITILAAIIFPVFARAKESGYRATALTQARQLGLALQQYLEGSDNRYLPSTNYGLPESTRNRMWPAGLYPFVKAKNLFAMPGTDGVYPESWDDRGRMTIGYSSATAIDLVQGCKENQPETHGCVAFTTAVAFDKADVPSMVGLFAMTPGGPTDDGYRGYEFSPYNGIDNPEKQELSPPLVSDRDLVQEMMGTPPELLKPLYARYGSTGEDDGVTPVIFADCHVKSYSAKQISGLASGIIWRFR